MKKEGVSKVGHILLLSLRIQAISKIREYVSNRIKITEQREGYYGNYENCACLFGLL